MNARRIAAVLFTALLCAAPAEARVRALFVGIDVYAYASATNGFENLHGAVNDVHAIKAALEAAYGWGIDPGEPAACPTTAPTAATVSITLVNNCATRAAILSALTGLVAVSAPGDTVLFYYAGHGAQIDDVTFFTKASGRNDTILTYDARGPQDADYHTEIVDRELNVIIENATHVQGANVVTIFDSCHSITATRSAEAGASRSAPTVTVPALHQPVGVLLPTRATVIGHRAHLAAAGDDEIAEEAPDRSGAQHGVFTTALSAAIKQLPGATIGDLLEAASLGVAQTPFGGTQHPGGDGRLMALDGSAGAGLLVAASASGSVVTLADGLLGNITAQSAFALFADWTSARANATPPLATGRVSSVADTSAVLALTAPPAAPLPASLVARETEHAFGSTKVGVGLRIADPAALAATRTALATIPFAETSPSPAVVVASEPGKSGRLLVQTRAALGLASLPPPADPGFAPRLRDALAPTARINALLALANAAGARELNFCIADRFYARIPGFVCPEPAPASTMAPSQDVLARDAIAYIAVENHAPDPRYVYVFAIADDNSVTLLTQQDAPLSPDRPQTIDVVPHYAGRIHFLVLATKAPIDGAALEQNGGARDGSSCTSALDRLLCEANNGTRDPATSHVGNWAGLVKTIAVVGNSAAAPQRSKTGK